MRKLKKLIKEKENIRIVTDAIRAWDPLGFAPFALEREYKPEIRDIASGLSKSMNATQIAELIADVFSLHTYPYVFETRQCLMPALQIKVGQYERGRSAKIAAAGCSSAALALLCAFMFRKGRDAA